jgi:hypothetical protein
LGRWSIGELERFFSNAPFLQRRSSPRLPVLKVTDPVGRQVFAVKRYKIDFIITKEIGILNLKIILSEMMRRSLCFAL